MTDSKLLVFGSFTEDETKSWMKSRSSESAKKPFSSSKRGDKPSEEKELLFGSFKLETGRVLGDSKSELSGHVSTTTNGPAAVQTSISLKKNDKMKILETPHDQLPGAVEAPRENGSIKNSTNGSALSNGASGIGLTSLQLSHNEVGHSYACPSLKFSVLNDVKDVDQNGDAYEPSVFISKEEICRTTSEPVKNAEDLQPRGLINSGNLCFLNATLQALLSCSPFIQLLHELRNRSIPKVGYPTLNAFAEFIADFYIPCGSSLKKKDSAFIETGRPFSPVMFEAVLKNFTPDVPSGISGRPRQEDAQEFLCFIMDQMHDELLKLQGQSASTNGAKSSLVSSAEDDEWETVGPKNTSAVTRTQSFVRSELSDIFGGQLKSVVKAKGNKASATVQPFLLLHLDIYPEAVRTIEEALHLYSALENLEGYRTSATGKAGVVTARKSVKIQKLSKIMILHLMRFSYGSQGSTKLHKPVRFPLELVLGRELLVTPSAEGRKYELVATITHHGRDPSKGHYTADARYSNGQWLRFDDASVTAISTSKVLHDQAYVLFYKQV